MTMPILVFGDDRGESIGIELVAETNLDLIFGQMMVRGHNGVGGVEEHKSGMSPIGIAVFRPRRPIVSDGIFEASANSPAYPGRRGTVGEAWSPSEESGCIIESIDKVREGDAAGGVD